ncbi:MAG TPA: hypothetical protein VGZ73_19235 [Bryobacteraceae bacterium]|nr:hypothetical protein [Bryobacteraceae bacterium]
MKRISSRIVIFAGLVSLPLAVSPRLGPSIPAADYRNDPRLERLRAFFAKLDCPAWEYAGTFLEAADDYALDWRLLPSLSYVESTGGKAARHNNLFGWNSGRARFSSPVAAIHMIGFRLAHSEMYRDKDLDALLLTYNPTADYVATVKSVMRRIAPTE